MPPLATCQTWANRTERKRVHRVFTLVSIGSVALAADSIKCRLSSANHKEFATSTRNTSTCLWIFSVVYALFYVYGGLEFPGPGLILAIDGKASCGLQRDCSFVAKLRSQWNYHFFSLDFLPSLYFFCQLCFPISVISNSTRSSHFIASNYGHNGRNISI